MKKIVFVIFLALLMIFGCEPNKPKDRTILDLGTVYQFLPEFLNGKLKEVKENMFWSKEENGKIVKGKEVSVKERDSLGYSKDFVVNFDENGVLVKSVELGDGKILDYYSIDVENGKTKRANLFIKDTLNLFILFYYDDKGLLTSLKGYGPKAQNLLFGWKLYNDINGDYAKIEFFNDKDKMTGHHDFVRNNEGKILGWKHYNSKDSLSYSMDATYNDKGFYQSQKLIGKKTNEYTLNYLSFDEKGNWLSVAIYKNGELKFYSERKYVYY